MAPKIVWIHRTPKLFFFNNRVLNFAFGSSGWSPYSLPTFCKDSFIWVFEQVNLTYWGTSTVLTILTPHRNDNDINTLAVFIIFISAIYLTREFSTTQLSKPLELCATNKRLCELTISSPFLSIYVLSSPS